MIWHSPEGLGPISALRNRICFCRSHVAQRCGFKACATFLIVPPQHRQIVIPIGSQKCMEVHSEQQKIEEKKLRKKNRSGLFGFNVCDARHDTSSKML